MLNISKFRFLSFSILGSMALTSCSPKLNSLLQGFESLDIMNGKEVMVGDTIASSIVGIYNVKEKYICTGSLIAQNIVMTAAHCVSGRPSELRIVFGNDLDEMINAREIDIREQHLMIGTDYKVSKKWDPSKIEFSEDAGDIALIKFKGSIPEGYKPATFLNDSSDIKVGQLVTLAGYGVSTIDSTMIDPSKYKNLDEAIADGEVYCDDDNKKKCSAIEMSGDGILRQTQAPIASIQETEVTLDERKSGTCSGDSGGPAYIEKNGQFYIFGVTSRGSFLCNDNGIYTNALTYTKWIEDTIKILR